MNKITAPEAWSGVADCLTCSIRDSVLFAGLDEKDFEKIHTPIRQFSYSAGQALYRKGDSGGNMFTIRKGLVKLVTYLPDGTQRVVRLLQRSDVLGLETLTDETYHHDAVALQPVEVCCFPAALVRSLSQVNSALCAELMRRWNHELEKADRSLLEFSTGSSRQRMARFLLELYKNSEDETVTLFSREDIGAVLGITTETASRIIAEFKRQSLISESGPNVFLCDIPNLERMLDP